MLIAWFQQLLKFGYLLGRGVSISDLLYLSLLVMPKILFISLPVIIVFGILIAYYELFESRVLVIYRSIGINNFHLALPALQFSLGALLLTYSISLYALPYSSGVFKDNLSYFRENFFFSVLEEKVFTPIAGSVVLYIGSKYNDNIVEDVVLFDHRDRANQSVILAEYGKISVENTTPQFHLRNGVRLGYDNIGSVAGDGADNNMLFFNKLDIGFQLGADNGAPRSRDIEEYYIYELLFPDAELSSARQHRLRTEGHKRIVWPLYIVVLCSLLLSIFLQFRDNRLGIGTKQWAVIVAMIVVPCYLYFASLSFVLKHPGYSFVMYILPTMWLVISGAMFQRAKL